MNFYDDDDVDAILAEGEALREEARALRAKSEQRRATSAPVRVASTAGMRLRDADRHLERHFTEAVEMLLPLYGKDGDSRTERLQDFSAAYASHPEIVEADLEAIKPGLVAEQHAQDHRKARVRLDAGFGVSREIGAGTVAAIPATSAFLADGSGRDIAERVLDRSLLDADPIATAPVRMVRGILEAGEQERARRGAKLNPYAETLIEGVGIDRALELAGAELPDDGAPSPEQADLEAKSLDELRALLDNAEPEHTAWTGTAERKVQPSDDELRRTIADLVRETETLDAARGQR